jgi:muconolactone delta-isomerase
MSKKQYIVEFTIIDPFDDEIEKLIPGQRMAVFKLFQNGILHSYTLSLDRKRLWAVFSADSESELVRILSNMPMHNLMDYDYTELMFHNSASYLPAVSMN